MLQFMHLAHPRHLDIYVQNSKHKSQNTGVTSFEHRTQNICIQNTMSHIGFRILPVKSPVLRKYVKDGLPDLFHSFRNKYFNKISLGNLLYFQNKL